MNTKTRNTLLTYFFLLLTFFVGILFTKNFYGQYVENKNTMQTLEVNIEEKKAEYLTLSQLKQDIEAGKYAEMNLEKYVINFSEDELTNYFYSYANTNPGKVRIESLSLDEWVQNDFGFIEWNINLTATFATELDMLNMISVLINDSKYNFYIHSLSYPFGEITWPFMVDIPLKVLYK